jgi:1-deoxy-D-xylulose-5-phosphate synthase
MLFTATLTRHPVCIRYPRGSAEGVPIKEQPAVLEIGRAQIIKGFSGRGSPKVTFISLGNMLNIAKRSAQSLENEGFDCAIINARFFKPLDEETFSFYAQNSDVVVTLEDNVLAGGFGSAVLELFSDRRIEVPVVRVGWPDKFIEHASTVDDLRQKYGLTPDKTVELVKSVLKKDVETSQKGIAVI